MPTVKYVYWEEDGAWLGYLQDYPDYWTQGETLDDLREHLRDLHKDVTQVYFFMPDDSARRERFCELYKGVTGGQSPGFRKVEELVIS